jgi:cell fate regulator YaaT (PSP1 superfamily)
MPKIGRTITFNDQRYKVRQHNVLKETVVVVNENGEEISLNKDEWKSAVTQPAAKDK